MVDTPMPPETSSAPSPAPAVNPEQVVLEALQIALASTGSERYGRVHAQLLQRMNQRAAGGATAAAPAQQPPQPSGRIRVICATRKDREDFFAQTALGRCLSLHRPAGVELRLFPCNTRGLPELYNEAIAESIHQEVTFLFIHDDIHLCDFHWADRLANGLSVFEVVGLVGNRRRVPAQPGWLFLDERLTRDSYDNLSGAVAHGRGLMPDSIDVFGPTGKAVRLLDGLFLAVSSATLRATSLRFDQRFDFHFYDLDFCRQAERAGLRLGTWPISVVHESAGNFLGDGWRRGYESYLDKWGD
jgi:Glycosyltransferase like family